MAPSLLAICWVLSSAVATVAADLGSRQPLAFRRAAIAQRQNAPDDCTLFDSLRTPDQDCAALAAYWGITEQTFISWNPQVGSNCENIKFGEEYCVERNWGLPDPTGTGNVPEPTSTIPSPTQTGIVSGCTKYYQAVEGDDCSKIVSSHGTFSLNEFVSWNPAVGNGCTGLWSGYWYCVAIEGTPTQPPTATTTTGNGIQTPTPTQAGMVSNCNKFHLIKDTTTCQGIADYNKVSLSDVFKWNTGINEDCTNLWLGSYVCAGVIGTSNPPPSTTTSAGNGIATPTPTQPGMVSNCNKFHLIKDTTTCQGIADYNKVALSDVLKWNTGVNKDCTNLWLGAYACAGVIGGSPPPTTTTSRPGNGIATPTPTQPGMVGNCNKFHLIKDTTTCQGIADYNKVRLSDIHKWNTGINQQCTNLWLGAYACAGVIGGSPPPTTTTSRPGNGIATPTPTQPGMVSNCNKFHLVKDTTTCQGMADYNRVSLANIKKWNTGLNSACSNLWLGTYACVGVRQSRMLVLDNSSSESSDFTSSDMPAPTVVPSLSTPSMVQVPKGTPGPSH